MLESGPEPEPESGQEKTKGNRTSICAGATPLYASGCAGVERFLGSDLTEAVSEDSTSERVSWRPPGQAMHPSAEGGYGLTSRHETNPRESIGSLESHRSSVILWRWD